jgi:transcription antitermination factor NusG
MSDYKTIPYEFKQLLRKYDNAVKKAKGYHMEILRELDRYNVPYEHVVGNTTDQPFNESLTHISYGEGDIEDNIAEMEEVFLHFAKKDSSSIYEGDTVTIQEGTLKGESSEVIAVEGGMVKLRCYGIIVTIEESKVSKA